MKKTQDTLHPCPYSLAVKCVLTDPCRGCETFAKYLIGEEVPRFSMDDDETGEGESFKTFSQIEGFRIDLYEDNSILRRRGVANLFCHPDDLKIIQRRLH